MNKKLILLYFMAIFISKMQLISAKYEKRENRNYDILHYNISIKVDLIKQHIQGNVKIKLIYLSNSDSLNFDAENLKIKKVQINNTISGFKNDEKKIYIHAGNKYKAPDTLIVSIDYECLAKNGKGIYFFRPDSKNTSARFQCYSQGEEELNHNWFPCYDYPDDRITSEMYITVDKKFTAISNGLLESVKSNPDSTKTFHWVQNKEHVSYLISFVIGEYIEIKDFYEKLPLSYFVYPEKVDDAKLIFPKTKEMLNFFETRLNSKYPWTNYSQIILQEFFGGMENTAATNLIDDLPDRKSFIFDEGFTHFYEVLMAHELSHQWFGDLITCRRWEDLWLNEGFAEFITGTYKGWKYGDIEEKLYFHDELENYLKINLKESMPTVSLKSNNVYPKGALILKMLRSITGEEVFWKIITNYVDRFRNSSIQTEDLKNIVDELTGNNNSYFFDQWLYKRGHPKFKVSGKYFKDRKEYILQFKQTQKIDSLQPLFTIPMDIIIYDGKERIKRKIYIDSISNSYYFKNLSDEPRFVSIDPERNIIKEIVFERTKNELLNQLQLSESIIDRVEAANFLKKYIDDSLVYNALKKSTSEDMCWKVRQSSINSLSKSKASELVDFLIAIFKSEIHPLVRREILHSLQNIKFNENSARLFYKSMYDSSSSVIVTAIQCITSFDSTKAFDTLIKFIEVNSYRNQIQEYVIGALVKLKDDRSIPYFIEYTQKAKSALARNAAFLGLVNLAKSHAELYDFFVENLRSESNYFKRQSLNGLGNIGNRAAIPLIEEINKTEKNSFMKMVIKDVLKKLK